MFLKNKLTLFEFCKYFPFTIRSAMEVGVYTADQCRLKEFIEAGTRVQLFEPNPFAFETLELKFKKYPNCTINRLAISDHVGKVKMKLNGSQTFISTINKPPCVSDDPHRVCRPDLMTEFEVDAKPISEFDDGSIDLLLVDTEGHEWEVIKTLKSRPIIVGLECHHENRYTNPNIEKINQWANENHYKILFINTGDKYFIRDESWGCGGNDNWKI
jgi:FkbM family methyltransferase